MSPEAKILAGTIGAAHGIKGEVKFGVKLDDPTIIQKEGVLYAKEGTPFYVESFRQTAKALLVRFKSTPDRDAAEALRGTELYLDAAALPPLAKNEFYYKDLVGLAVVDHTNNTIGRVIGVFYSGAQHILTLQVGGREVLVPFIEDTIGEVTKTRLALKEPAQAFINL